MNYQRKSRLYDRCDHFVTNLTNNEILGNLGGFLWAASFRPFRLSTSSFFVSFRKIGISGFRIRIILPTLLFLYTFRALFVIFSLLIYFLLIREYLYILSILTNDIRNQSLKRSEVYYVLLQRGTDKYH
jgi:hypothetical protein